MLRREFILNSYTMKFPVLSFELGNRSRTITINSKSIFIEAIISDILMNWSNGFKNCSIQKYLVKCMLWLFWKFLISEIERKIFMFSNINYNVAKISIYITFKISRFIQCTTMSKMNGKRRIKRVERSEEA